MIKTKVSYFILGVLISVILLLTMTELVAFNEEHYMKLFVKYDVAKATGLELEELKDVMGDVMLYLKDDRPTLNTTILINGQEEAAFGERAVLHMIDVKKLLTAGRNIRNYGILVIAALFGYFFIKDKKWKENLSKTLFYVGVVNIVLMVLLFCLMMLDFYKYFTYFHLIFFNNDLWILEADELMIQMLPEGFFNDTAVKIGIYFFIGNLLLVLMSLKGYGKIKVKK